MSSIPASKAKLITKLDVLQKRTTAHSLKKHTVDYLAIQTKSFAYTRKVLADLYTQVKDEVARLGGNKMLEAILERLDVPSPAASEAGP